MALKQPYLKIAAVVSAVLLGGAFVSYRAGAFSLHTQTELPVEVRTPALQLTPADQPAVFMSGSKISRDRSHTQGAEFFRALRPHERTRNVYCRDPSDQVPSPRNIPLLGIAL